MRPGKQEPTQSFGAHRTLVLGTVQRSRASGLEGVNMETAEGQGSRDPTELGRGFQAFLAEAHKEPRPGVRTPGQQSAGGSSFWHKGGLSSNC